MANKHIKKCSISRIIQSVQFSHSVVSNSAIPWAAACQPSLSINNSWILLKLMSTESVMPSNHLIPFSSCPQSFSASGSFPMSWLVASGDQSIGASASVLSMNIQGLFPLGLTGLISLLSNRFSRVFSSIAV